MAPLSGSRPDALIVIILILVILSGFIVAYYDHTQGTSMYSTQLSEGESDTISPPLRATLESVTNDQINVTVFDTETGETNQTGLISLGDTSTLTLRSQEINVTYAIDTSNNDAVVSYEIPVTYAWDNIAVLFVGSVGVIVLGLFVYMILETLNFRGE